MLSLENVSEDELGNAYEFWIKKFADNSGHTAQEFYTNRTLVHLMAQPKADESIYDPTCGTGGMLISSLAKVAKQDYSLSIPLYVRRRLTTDKPEEAKSLKKIWEDSEEAGREFRPEMDAVVEMLDGLQPEE